MGPSELTSAAREHRAELLAVLDTHHSDLAVEAAERAAIIAESEYGNACMPVPHHLPTSWADAGIMPTAGGGGAGAAMVRGGGAKLRGRPGGGAPPAILPATWSPGYFGRY